MVSDCSTLETHNCHYCNHSGKFIERKDRYTKVEYLFAEKVARKVQCKEFCDMDYIKGNIYLVKMNPRSYPADVPMALGSFILTKAKEVMLNFYFKFMDHYYDRKYWELVSMDTDSVCLN